MRITRDTPDQLIIDRIPIVGAVIAGVVAAAFLWLMIDAIGRRDPAVLILIPVGGAVLYWGLSMVWRRDQIVFDRVGDTVTLRRSTLRHRDETIHALSEIARAETEDEVLRGSPHRRSYLVIEAGESKGRHPLMPDFDQEGWHDEITGRINDWLAGARTGG